MEHVHVEEIFDKGVHALENGHIYLALACFEEAASLDRSPLHCSYLALCLAKVRSQFAEAVALCREAVKKDPGNAVHYLHLGRVYIMAEQKKRALMVLRRGLRCENREMILHELVLIGDRKKPVLPKLDRGHPLNRYLGIILGRLGLR
ncbi:MAG: tetratricopeptide repeat protein [Geobacteraceae bacterium]|nr:tetratricopeptide repeat protein [Geobacteraceae bacterium]